MVTSLHLLCGLSLRHCNFILGCLGLIIRLARGPGSNTEPGPSLFRDIPLDTRTLLRDMDIEPSSLAFVCCPKCYKCYMLDDSNSYPERCTNKATSTSNVCHRRLRKTRTIKGKVFTFPSRRFLYQDMKKWLAGLLSRPGIEELLDCDISQDNPDHVADILESKVLREFLGPDKKPFLRSGSQEGRYVFSLCMDGFNPYHMKEAGKKVSVGAIYMVCLNLPPEIRYNFENMFLVGIIPGPTEPSLDQINHLLRPLVDDLLIFWQSGVYYASTPLFPGGRTVRCAIIPLVCDLPAARQMAGYASFASRHFCSMCLQRLEDIDDLDSHWHKRSCAAHRMIAEQWRVADSEAKRQVLFESHGIRYSELLRLPYWDPTLFTLVDSMHSLFLGDFRRHCRHIWKMNVTFADSDGSWIDPGSPELHNAISEDNIEKGWVVLRTGTDAALSRVTKAVLQELCRQTQSMPQPRYMQQKKHLVKKLKEYVCAKYLNTSILSSGIDSLCSAWHKDISP
jgi:Transposase family tnp2